MPPLSLSPSAVLDFWFGLERPGKKDDAAVLEALGGLYGRAARGELDGWAVGDTDPARERLALILLLDQAPRHLFRGDARAYATDHKAAGLTALFMGASAQEDLLVGASPGGEHGIVGVPPGGERSVVGASHGGVRWGGLTPLEIFYATHPWLHAEDEARQARINPIYHRIAPVLPGLEFMAAIADLYWETLRRFGRFPHRNAILGRETTEEEALFLKTEWNQRRRGARNRQAVEAKAWLGKGG